jgi:hypothetical protein
MEIALDEPNIGFLCNVLWIVVCPFVHFLLAIVLSVLRFMDSDYPFGIFKLFSESVSSRRTDNTMVKWKRKKTFYKTLHRKLKIEQHEPHYKPGWTQVLKWLKENGQKDKQRSTKHYTENQRSSNTNLTVGELMSSGRVAISAPLVTPAMLLLNEMNIIWHGNRVGRTEHVFYAEIVADITTRN